MGLPLDSEKPRWQSLRLALPSGDDEPDVFWQADSREESTNRKVIIMRTEYVFFINSPPLKRTADRRIACGIFKYLEYIVKFIRERKYLKFEPLCAKVSPLSILGRSGNCSCFRAAADIYKFILIL